MPLARPGPPRTGAPARASTRGRGSTSPAPPAASEPRNARREVRRKGADMAIGMIPRAPRPPLYTRAIATLGSGRPSPALGGASVCVAGSAAAGGAARREAARRSSKRYCVSCHAFPAPDVLPRASWARRSRRWRSSSRARACPAGASRRRWSRSPTTTRRSSRTTRRRRRRPCRRPSPGPRPPRPRASCAGPSASTDALTAGARRRERRPRRPRRRRHARDPGVRHAAGRGALGQAGATDADAAGARCRTPPT